MYFWVRWFGLDTVLAVSSVHLLVMQSQWTVPIAVGLGIVTSFFYMCDRLVDMKWGHEGVSNRHLIYQARPLLLIGSLLILGSGSVMFWFLLPAHIQWPLVVVFGLFLCHVGLLSLAWYQQGKDLVVSLIFTVVMVVFQWHDVDYRLVSLIFFYTLFNLRIHGLIDQSELPHRLFQLLKSGRGMVVVGLMLGVLWVGIQCDGWVGLTFGVGLFFHLLLLCWPGRYWFELGEVWYALPFFIVASKKMLA